MRAIRNPWAAAGLASVLAMFAAAQAGAQDAAPPAQPDAAAAGNDRIVVRGQRMDEALGDLEDHVSDFIDEVTQRPRGAGFARFHRRVCIGVYNLDEGPAQYIADRISMLAMDVGLTPGEPGCEPDVLIVFTTDGPGTARRMVEESPGTFRPGGGAPYMQAGVGAMDRFAASTAPVNWWHVSLPVDSVSGNRAIWLPSVDGAWSYPTVMNGGGGGSRLYRQIRDEMLYSIVIVDVKQLEAVTWEELGDYLAVVSLAQIDPQTDPARFDSILNLFTNPDAYTGLTDWDRAFMRALYNFNQTLYPRVQEVMLINEMANGPEATAAREGR